MVKGGGNETYVVLGIMDFTKRWKFPTSGRENIIMSALAPVVARKMDIQTGKMPVGNLMVVPSLKIVERTDETKPKMLKDSLKAALDAYVLALHEQPQRAIGGVVRVTHEAAPNEKRSATLKKKAAAEAKPLAKGRGTITNINRDIINFTLNSTYQLTLPLWCLVMQASQYALTRL